MKSLEEFKRSYQQGRRDIKISLSLAAVTSIGIFLMGWLYFGIAGQFAILAALLGGWLSVVMYGKVLTGHFRRREEAALHDRERRGEKDPADVP
jgi:xanthine/uracil permease